MLGARQRTVGQCSGDGAPPPDDRASARGRRPRHPGRVVVNLQKSGSPEQQAADAWYVAPMTALMARGGFGPLHVAGTEVVAGSHGFDTIVIVYYLNLEFFADMIGSSYYQGIYADKQLGDVQATVTGQILGHL